MTTSELMALLFLLPPLIPEADFTDRVRKDPLFVRRPRAVVMGASAFFFEAIPSPFCNRKL